MRQERVEARLKGMGRAYKQLLAGSAALLEINSLYWTEKLLLKIVRRLCGARLDQLGKILPDE